MKKLLLCMFTISLTLLSACGGISDFNEPNEPKITSFWADKSNIIAGTGVNLTPVFSNGTGTVDNGIGQVTSGTSVLVRPDSTTKYTLTVKNSDGKSVISTTIVKVSEPDLLEKLAGKVKFDYTINSFLFSTTANFSSVVFDGKKYLLDRVTNTSCLLFESPSFEYFCMKINTSGSKDVFVFDMTSNTKGAGKYEFCRSSESDETCALGIMSPDGDVKVTVINSSLNRQLKLVVPPNFEHIYNDVEIYKQGSDMDSYSETAVLNRDSEQVGLLRERIETLQQIISLHNSEEQD